MKTYVMTVRWSSEVPNPGCSGWRKRYTELTGTIAQAMKQRKKGYHLFFISIRTGVSGVRN